ncbi:MAG: hypothetical protein AAB701_00085 [Patescibacteria group bacterium]
MLLFFHGRECEHCLKMSPLVTELERELSVTVDRKETWHDEHNARLLVEEYDVEGKRCGGVPFFFNTETKQWLCGEVEYADLKRWASGGSGHAE